MKVLYSNLKKYLPDLTDDLKDIVKAYTLIGYMLDGVIVEVEIEGKKDYLLDLEVRQNRADCFGVIGLARELSAYYNIPLKLEPFEIENTGNDELDIQVTATNAVKRVMAVGLENLEIKDSPGWLKEFLNAYDINSINNLVDLTNYVMLQTGHASHAFDLDKFEGNKLVWELNEGKYGKMQTLNGETLNLSKDALIISNGKEPLSLSFIGGKVPAIDQTSKRIILEMAIYDGGLVRRNSRQMNTTTEAGSRLEKYLDPESIPFAFNMLVNLILEHCGGKINSKVYDNYLQKTKFDPIEVRLDKAQQVAGIEIPYSESRQFLERLGFKIESDKNGVLIVTRPTDRLDIEQEEDVFEEIIRLKGYDKIPSDKLFNTITKDHTPSHLKLIDSTKNTLVSLGYDEVRSWILVDSEKNAKANFNEWEQIEVTNSINEGVPFLRQTISVSLIGQLEEMQKNFIDPIKIFEEGKVFGKTQKNYEEYYHLSGLVNSNDINSVKHDVEVLLRSNNLDNLSYSPSQIIPEYAHRKSCYDINVDAKKVGIIFITNKSLLENEVIIFELNLSLIDQLINTKTKKLSTFEVTNKIVSLDTNIYAASDNELNNVVQNKLQSIENSVWGWFIVDKFKESEDKFKYTIRVEYLGMSDIEAKEMHGKMF